MLIFIGALMIVGLVILHELGHFYAARKSGVEVEEFGIGFPPKAKSLGTKNGTEYTLNWLPLGGFVKLKGEHDSDDATGSYGAASIGGKIKIMSAGVIVNFLTAIFLLTIVAAVGLPQALEGQFYVDSDSKIVTQDTIASFVAEDSPAATAGLEAGNVLLSIKDIDCDQDCDYTIDKSSNLGGITESLAGKETQLSYRERGSDAIIISDNITLRGKQEVEQSRADSKACFELVETNGEGTCEQSKGYLGVVSSDYVERRATWSAPIVAVAVTGQFTKATFVNLGTVVSDLFKGDTEQASQQVTGVIGIGYILSELSSQGFMSILFLTAVISLSLAVMNILPIPALDGGRLFVTLLFRAIKKPLTKETEEKIHGTGFMMLMLLFVLITVVDVQRFII